MRSDQGEAQAIIGRDVEAIVAALAGKLDFFAGATVLVTGASGMFGGYLADVVAALNRIAALSAPCSLVLATRTRPEPDGRLGHLLDRNDVRFVVGDPLLPAALPPVVDVIIHAASPASPRKYLRDPVGTLDANSHYLRALLELAKSSRARGVLFVSSSEVYGSPPPEAIPTPETYVGATDPLSPRACYVEGKRFGEALAMAYFRQHGLPVSIVRPFHVHGPGLRLDDGRIVADLIRVGFSGDQFMLSSDGTATRTYGYVSDAAIGAFRALFEAAGETYNIGTDSPETSILELATVVADLMSTLPPAASSSPLPPHLVDAPLRSRPDLTKAKQRLGYEPQVSLRDGLARTIAWHRTRLQTARHA